MTARLGKKFLASAALGLGALGFAAPATQAEPVDTQAQFQSAAHTAMLKKYFPVVSEGFEERDYSRKEAFHASTGRIVFHYGKGLDIEAADSVRLLSKHGYPAIFLPGGKDGTISVFVNRSYPIDYTGDSIIDGAMDDTAIGIFHDRVGKPNNTVETAETKKDGGLASTLATISPAAALSRD